jgi:branched-chain amino acid transport system substrate-binding protein
MISKLFFLLISVQLSLHSQTNDELNRLFNSAVGEFKNAKYTESLESFEKIVNEYQLNSKTSLALLFIGKINLATSNYNEAEKSLLRLMDEFPQSRYLDEAQITLSQIYLDQEEYLKSFFNLCDLMDKTSDAETEKYAEITAERIAQKYLSALEVKSIHDSTKLVSLKPFLLLLTGQIYLSEQKNNLARDTFNELVILYPNSQEKETALKLYNETPITDKIIEQSDVIGVVLPLTTNGSKSLTSLQILEGIKFALSEFNEDREHKIGILILDTEAKREKLEEIYYQLRNIENLRCILGPIYSSEVRDALEVFKKLNLPIISPTATDDYLTNLNPDFFQANPSFKTRGRLIAQYVYYVANKRKIAVLNSIDGYSPILSSSFSQEFEQLGGKIILRETYRSKNFDLTEQMNSIAVSSNQIEGIYIPLSDKVDIPAIVSNLSQIDLNMPIYGDQDWMTTSGLEAASFLDNNLIFCSDYFLKYNDLDYQEFSKHFFDKTKLDVNRNMLYGYDVMKYILTILRSSFSSGSSLEQKMTSGVSTVGFHNNICFDSTRINRYMNIIRYSNGKFELIDKFKLSN